MTSNKRPLYGGYVPEGAASAGEAVPRGEERNRIVNIASDAICRLIGNEFLNWDGWPGTVLIALAAVDAIDSARPAAPDVSQAPTPSADVSHSVSAPTLSPIAIAPVARVTLRAMGQPRFYAKEAIYEIPFGDHDLYLSPPAATAAPLRQEPQSGERDGSDGQDAALTELVRRWRFMADASEVLMKQEAQLVFDACADDLNAAMAQLIKRT